MPEKGKLVVLEGIDGSGKSTQLARLCDHLQENHINFRQISFPCYREPSSALVRMYLAGEFGANPGDVNPYAASAFYAVDRFASFKKDWGEYYTLGGTVVMDRYTTSNAICQGAKLPKEEREGFFRWLCEFEFEKLQLPAPDAVIYLDMPVEQAMRNLRSRESQTHTRADIHEIDPAFLESCRDSAMQAAKVLRWKTISCTDGNRFLPVEEIHEKIWDVLSCAI